MQNILVLQGEWAFFECICFARREIYWEKTLSDYLVNYLDLLSEFCRSFWRSIPVVFAVVFCRSISLGDWNLQLFPFWKLSVDFEDL